MIRLSLAILLAFTPAAFAQPYPGNQPTPGQDSAGSRPQRGITREQFVNRAAEMAGRRFDAIDTSHTGIVTRDQIRAFREAHQRLDGAAGVQ